jgi:hypothetical protein
LRERPATSSPGSRDHQLFNYLFVITEHEDPVEVRDVLDADANPSLVTRRSGR